MRATPGGGHKGGHKGDGPHVQTYGVPQRESINHPCCSRPSHSYHPELHKPAPALPRGHSTPTWAPQAPTHLNARAEHGKGGRGLQVPDGQQGGWGGVRVLYNHQPAGKGVGCGSSANKKMIAGQDTMQDPSTQHQSRSTQQRTQQPRERQPKRGSQNGAATHPSAPWTRRSDIWCTGATAVATRR
jgi:hypothetical protein